MGAPAEGVRLLCVVALLRLCAAWRTISNPDEDEGIRRSLYSPLFTAKDDALDPLSPTSRADAVFAARVEAALKERNAAVDVHHMTNAETEEDGTPLLWMRFHKSLPHDELGQVDEEAYGALEECIFSGDFNVCETVPAGGASGYLVNPLGGLVVTMSGAASSALTVMPPPSARSPELAAHLAECYWMALARDVPFYQYAENEITLAAAENLVSMPGFQGTGYDVSLGQNGTMDPLQQLFRASFVGVDKGPMVSQLLLADVTLDSITFSPRAVMFAPGLDYMTDFSDWLHIQNGGEPDGVEEEDIKPRFIHTARDLARLVFTDKILTEAFRAALILVKRGAIDDDGFNGPYHRLGRQQGFVDHGNSGLMRGLGEVEGSNRVSWYQKWRVHRVARPEALGGVLHNTIVGELKSTLHESLLNNTELLERVMDHNCKQNGNSQPSYLLPMAVKEGSPVHPSYPSGHAVQNGAFATFLKANVGLQRGMKCFVNPVETNEEGSGRQTYRPTEDERCIDENGEETRGLTYEGEINKLATNVALGRQMLGVHYRADSIAGMLLGETYVVRLLQQEASFLDTKFPYEFRLFRGDVIKLHGNWVYSINGQTCSTEAYSGVDSC